MVDADCLATPTQVLVKQQGAPHLHCKWELVPTLVGMGGFGAVAPVCCSPIAAQAGADTTSKGAQEAKAPPADCTSYVAKFVPFAPVATVLPASAPAAFRHEVAAQELCGRAGRGAHGTICPPVAEAWLCEHGGMIVMPAVRITLRNLLLITTMQRPLWLLPQEVRTVLIWIMADALLLVRRFHREVGLVHNDLHDQNVMADYDTLGPVRVATLTPEQQYAAAHFRYRIIDLAKAEPLAKDAQQRAAQMAYDNAFLCDAVRYTLRHWTDARPQGYPIEDVLAAPLAVLQHAVIATATTPASPTAQQLVDAVRDETTFIDVSVFGETQQQQQQQQAWWFF